jgi:hypothetical protein
LEARIGRSQAASPLTAPEIENILQRVQNGHALQFSELPRIEAHGHIVGKNLIISVHRGAVKVKRYLGIDDMDVV